jgi:glycogen(starch) synthase
MSAEPSGRESREQAGRGAARAWPGTHVFEVSWEVCNQVGGIYQVLRSKAPIMVERWRHQYCVVGPYVPQAAALEFEPIQAGGWLGAALEDLAAQGIRAHHGRWLVPSKPRAILLEHGDIVRLAGVRDRLRREHGIDAREGEPLLDGVLTFGDAVARLLDTLARHWVGGDTRRPRTRRLLAHFHEWLAGVPVPLLRASGAPVATVFTTHATQVGRYAASNEPDFYDQLPGMDAEAKAERYGIGPKHAIERVAARACDVFTTLSPITAEECTALLGRKPDLLTPNGLDIDRFDLGPDFQTMHAQNKEAIHRFAMGHFFPSYAFDLERTLYFFTAGRYEPRNKGYDLCLEAMARLNAELRAANLGVTVVFFIVTDQPTRSVHPTPLHSRGVLDELREVSQRLTARVAEQLFRRGAAGERFRLDELADEYWKLRFRRTQQALRTDELPLPVTHILENDAGDPVLNHIRTLQLTNRREDPVKVVYHPEFITSVNPLWGIEYEQFVRGCHLGVFPSVYEPWGYTPLECIAMGVPAVTSDLAGFGRYAAEACPDHDLWGLHVLARRGRSFQDAAAELTRKLVGFCRLDRRARIALRNEVESHSRLFDWTRLGVAYHEAHDRALETQS